MGEFVWKHVQIEPECTDKINKKWTCLYCEKSYQGTATRVLYHLGCFTGLGIAACPMVPEEVKNLMIQKEDEKKASKLKKRKIEVLDQVTKSQSSRQQSFAECVKRADKNVVDAAVARMFYANGLPFNLAKSKQFKEAVSAIAKFGSGYQPPTYDALRTNLLNNEKKSIEKQVNHILESADTFGCTVTSDGWSNVVFRPLLNAIIVTEQGPVFQKALDTSGETKNAEYIANFLDESIIQIGPERVVEICTDSAPVCKAATNIITKKYPWIVWVPCTAHCIDLFLEDVGKLDWVKPVISNGRQIIQFFTNHHKSLAIFRSKSKLELLKPGETRFASFYIALSRLLQVRESIEETVSDREFKQTYKQEVKTLQNLVNDDSMWDTMEILVILCDPVVDLLRLVDASRPGVIGKVYRRCFEIQEHIKNLQNLTNNQINEIWYLWYGRWDMLHTDLHSAGYALDPEFLCDKTIHSSTEIMQGVANTIEKIFHQNPDAQAKAMMQLEDFRAQKGFFGREMVKVASKQYSPHRWWKQFGNQLSELQYVAIRVLAQPSSACACERNWSNFDFIHSKRRNRLQSDRANDLVYVFSNLRLCEKVQKIENENIPWQQEEEEESEG